ncbi:MAG: hypothetical protein A2579_01695 [Lysobacterales bacterium RIFOXYD1_FULL_69_11]|nr:MAG: hypothetical protein A2190_11380 [Xanthomonadales bacterium RIFOXYA1_FULL_69_10]OHE88389.1 MAG: hypothetical protein A2579_01695 [Xanthomonadales bacterium RIFOXYD1_FULL_69_11]
MAYRVTLDTLRGNIDVRYWDCVAVEQREAACQETCELLEQGAPRRILIDFTQARQVAEPLSKISGFASKLAADDALRQCRIAFVGPETSSFNVALETLSSARGYAFQRFFCRADAQAWLHERDRAPAPPPQAG